VYLLAQFLSGSTNFRRDAYGGSTENRARIVTEIAAAARALVGPDYPLWLRINGQEYDTEGGVTLEEAALISRLAEDAGYDAISVSAGSPHYDATIQSMYADRGALVPLAERIKQAVSIPVIVTGRLDPDLGDEILRRGQADFIAIGRALLADPELPAKALAGRAADVTPCVAALNCVNRGVLRDAPITCLVNPALGWNGNTGSSPPPSREPWPWPAPGRPAWKRPGWPRRAVTGLSSSSETPNRAGSSCSGAGLRVRTPSRSTWTISCASSARPA